MKCLGLDIGSTSLKGCVLDLEARKLSPIVGAPFPMPVAGLLPGRFEIDPELVLEEVQTLLGRLLKSAPDAEAIYFCGQMAGVVLVDMDGKPLGNYLSWRDQRTLGPHPEGGNYLDAIARRWTSGELAELGNELKPGSTSSLLFWLADHGQMPAGLMPATLGDFVAARLAGVPPRIEPTQAIGLLDLRTGDWHRAALDRLGLGGLAWQPLAKANEPIGHWHTQGRKLAIYPVLGDQQCALRGAGLTEGDLSLNVSTGAQVSQVTKALQLGSHQTRPYFDGQYLNTITHLPAGRSLNVLVSLLTELSMAQGVTAANPWPYIAHVAETAEGDGLSCNLAFFPGPMGESGSITGITTENFSVGNLFYAAFHNMAQVFEQCAERLCPQQDWKRVVLSGGLTQSVPVLRRILEARFAGNPPGKVVESSEREETLAGLLASATGS